MKGLRILAIAGTLIALSGCATQLPSGISREFGDEGWARVSSHDTASVWVNSADPDTYVFAKGNDIFAVVPMQNDWVEVYVDNKPAINVKPTHNMIWNRSDEPWTMTKDPTEQSPVDVPKAAPEK